MQDTVSKTNVLPGGAFLIKDTPANQTFTPEDFNEEQRMVKAMVNDFIKNEIDPVRAKIEKQEGTYSVDLLEKAAELGILGSHMPETYGGMAMDTNTNTLICEAFGPGGSWIVAYAAHTGIGMLPILYFGTEDQKSIVVEVEAADEVLGARLVRHERIQFDEVLELSLELLADARGQDVLELEAREMELRVLRGGFGRGLGQGSRGALSPNPISLP